MRCGTEMTTTLTGCTVPYMEPYRPINPRTYVRTFVSVHILYGTCLGAISSSENKRMQTATWNINLICTKLLFIQIYSICTIIMRVWYGTVLLCIIYKSLYKTHYNTIPWYETRMDLVSMLWRVRFSQIKCYILLIIVRLLYVTKGVVHTKRIQLMFYFCNAETCF